MVRSMDSDCRPCDSPHQAFHEVTYLFQGLRLSMALKYTLKIEMWMWILLMV